MVIKNEGLKSGLTRHSDLGVQYANNEFHSLLKTKEILYSMSQKGECLENKEIFFFLLESIFI